MFNMYMYSMSGWCCPLSLLSIFASLLGLLKLSHEIYENSNSGNCHQIDWILKIAD